MKLPGTMIHEDTEAKRLEVVQSLGLLDRPQEERYLRIARLVREHFRVRSSSISLVDETNTTFIAQAGMDSQSTPREETLCFQVVQGKSPLVIAEQTPDSENPEYQALAARLNLNFYAGVPMLAPDGSAVGVLCIHDCLPRRFTRKELSSLIDFAAIVEDEMLIKSSSQANRELISQIEHLRIRAFVDHLTGIWNRAAILDVLSREMERACRHKKSLSVCMLDLDRFKSVNDTYGHAAGDEVLRQASKRLKENIRTYDSLGRYGGEEFLLIFPETQKDLAITLAQRLCQSIRETPFLLKHDLTKTVTISIGVTELEESDSAQTLVSRADQALYQAKALGRDQAVLWSNKK